MKSLRGKEYSERLRSLKGIYAEIAEWSHDSRQVSRILEAVNPISDLAIVGEAIGPETLRMSGVNYFRANGQLGWTGRYLEELLHPAGFTLYPPSRITFSTGELIPSYAEKGLRTAYCTDLCPEFPGYVIVQRKKFAKRAIRRPNPARILSALAQGFLDRELDVVKPKAILLLGASAYMSFCTHMLHRSPECSLGEAVRDLSRNLGCYKGAIVVPALHPSPASPAFQRWIKEFRVEPSADPLVRCLRSAMRET